MVVYNIVRETALDEVELCLGLIEIEHKGLIDGRDFNDISRTLNKIYDIYSTPNQIRLLYEPTISDMEVDLRLQFEAMNLYY